MSLLPIPEPTQEQNIALAVSQLSSQVNGSLDNLKRNIQIAWDLFWHNPQATPQQICDALGNNAYKIFQESGFWQAAIKQRDPDYEELVPPNEFVINQDGTVEIIPNPEPQPEVVETPESENENG
jgi:hypothetical protein